MRNTSLITLLTFVVSVSAATTARATSWVIGYPWGPTHNGTAYMQSSQCQAASGGYVFTAQQSSQHSGYAYISGTCYDPTLYNVSSATHGVQAYISAPTNVGAWPAFWLTTEGAWTGEMDVAEWKGSGTANQNTYSANGTWQTYGKSANHTYFKVQTSGKTSSDATVQYYVNGSLTSTQTGGGFIGKNFYIIFDLQTGGSAGSATFSSIQMSFNGYSRW